MAKFFKTPDQISALMHHWFLSYHSKDRDFFSGAETFTFFDLIPEGLQRVLLQRASLDEHEKPVFLLDCGNAGFVLNTTHRFIRIGESDFESIFYTDFICHRGYNSIRTEGAPIGIKSDGYFAEFGLKVQNHEIIYWLIPSGRAGFAFWNVTKKCELIGRKVPLTSSRKAANFPSYGLSFIVNNDHYYPGKSLNSSKRGSKSFLLRATKPLCESKAAFCILCQCPHYGLTIGQCN